jgi:hypothetical protein
MPRWRRRDRPRPGSGTLVVELWARLAETEGLRPAIQPQARAELTAEGMPVIRSTVARRACAILDLHQLQ